MSNTKKYSCGNDPQPGDVVEVVTMDDLPELEKTNWAIGDIRLAVSYTVNEARPYASCNGKNEFGVYLVNRQFVHPVSRFRLIRRAGEQPQPGDEEVRTPIQDALYATSKFTTDDCTLLADGILMYLKDAGMGIVRQPQPDMAKMPETSREKLLILAEWFDKVYKDSGKSDDVQKDLRKIASELEEKEREIERLKEQVNDLKMDAAAHEYNEAERIKFQPEYEREICVRFAEYIGGLEMKMYKDGWCEPGGSNGFYYSTNDLYTKFLGEHTANH
jgi:hypothetical protein